jgi:hypothetical protein
VPYLGYDVPFLQRGQPSIISPMYVSWKGHILVHFTELITVPNSPHPFGLGGSRYLWKDFPFKESILFAVPWERVHTSLPYINILRLIGYVIL